ncbi:hypothetical protein Gohar_013806 [Gossypium harknessii]|uniref:Uncharacterized protein n=1 Tax=Gossypium harknessii TaxID=34285 RepID=A0A7J9H196_9ROSI|nr:hypothetical protein [Gossypium harknessii]
MSGTLLVADFVVGASHAGSSSGVGWATKKVRQRSDVPPDIKDPTVNENGRQIPVATMDKASYKATLMGSSLFFDVMLSHFNVLDEILGKIGTEEIAYNKEIQIGKLINVKNLTGPVKSQKDKGAKNSNFPKKNNSKAKGKGIHVASGLKMSFNILKPVNGTNGSSSSSGHLVFYDGSKMGKNTVIDGDEPFSFQPIQVRGPLDSIKHKAVKIMDKTSVSISGKENGSFRFGETSQSGENSSQRPMGMEEFQPIRPPDKEVRSSDQATMEVATVLEEIVTTIEQHSLTVNVRVDDNDFVEVIDAKSSRNDENMC